MTASEHQADDDRALESTGASEALPGSRPTIDAATDRFLADIAAQVARPRSGRQSAAAMTGATDRYLREIQRQLPGTGAGPAESARVVSLRPLSSDASGPAPADRPREPVLHLAAVQNRHNVAVTWVRASLHELEDQRRNATRRAARHGRMARAGALMLLPATVLLRADLRPGGAMPHPDQIGTLVSLTCAAVLWLVGAVVTWRVTTPPFTLARRPPSREVMRLMRVGNGAAELAVRLAAGFPSPTAARRAEQTHHLPPATLARVQTPREAVELARSCSDEVARDTCGADGSAAAAMLLPVVALFLPAVALALLA